jgi:uncharacterized membrane protein
MSNTQLSAFFIPVIVVIMTYRLQFIATEGCLDTFDWVVYVEGFSVLNNMRRKCDVKCAEELLAGSVLISI